MTCPENKGVMRVYVLLSTSLLESLLNSYISIAASNCQIFMKYQQLKQTSQNK